MIFTHIYTKPYTLYTHTYVYVEMRKISYFGLARNLIQH